MQRMKDSRRVAETQRNRERDKGARRKQYQQGPLCLAGIPQEKKGSGRIMAAAAHDLTLSR